MLEKKHIKTVREKLIYNRPKIDVIDFQLECTIAASSARIKGPDDDNTPLVTDWIEKKDEQSWDF